jgi:hypothetical protein
MDRPRILSSTRPATKHRHEHIRCQKRRPRSLMPGAAAQWAASPVCFAELREKPSHGWSANLTRHASPSRHGLFDQRPSLRPSGPTSGSPNGRPAARDRPQCRPTGGADRPIAQGLLSAEPHAGTPAVAIGTTTKMSVSTRFIGSLPLRVDHVPLSCWHDRAETAAREPSLA